MPHDIDTYEAGGYQAISSKYHPRIESLRASLANGRPIVLVRRRIAIPDAEAVLAAVRGTYATADVYLVAVNDSEANADIRVQQPRGASDGLLVATGPSLGSHWMGCNATWDAVIDESLLHMGLAQESPFIPAIHRIALAVLGSDWVSVEAQVRSHVAAGTLDEVPAAFVRALVAAEDHRFWEHRGVDFLAILRATVGLMTGRNLGGGSTIEQQLYRTLSGARGRSVRRKLRELLGATALSLSLTKSDMAKLYLVVAYYGAGMNGFSQACSRLGISPEVAGIEDAAALAARLKYPDVSSNNTKRRRQINTRTDYILKRCV